MDRSTDGGLKSLPARGYTFAISQDEKLLFSAGHSGADLYDVEKGTLLKSFALSSFPTQYGSAIQTVAFSPDNKTVFVSTDEGMLMDAQSGKVLRILSSEQASSAAFSPDGSFIATARDTTKIWDVRTGSLLKTLALPDFDPYSVAFSPDGSAVAVASSYSGTGARVWNTASGQLIRKLEHPPCATPTPWLRPTLAPIDSNFWKTTGVAPTTSIAVAINRDIVTLHADGSNRIRLTNYHYNDDPMLSPDKQWIAYRSLPQSIVQQGAAENSWFTNKRNIWIINTKTSQAIKITDSELDRGTPLWSPDSAKIAFTEGMEQKRDLVEIDIATQARRIIAANVNAARYHPGGNGIAYTNDQGDLVWVDNSGTTRIIVQGKPKLRVSDVDWMPDGQRLVYVLSDSTNPDLPDTPFGIAYSMWMIGIDHSNPHKLADGLHDISVAPDGKYIASYEGSGYADAGHVFLSVAFLQLAPDLVTGTVTKFDQFTIPSDIIQWQYNPQYPSIAWVGGHLPVASYGDGTISLVDLDHKTFMTVSQPETYP